MFAARGVVDTSSWLPSHDAGRPFPVTKTRHSGRRSQFESSTMWLDDEAIQVAQDKDKNKRRTMTPQSQSCPRTLHPSLTPSSGPNIIPRPEMALTTDPIAFVLAFKWLLVGGLLATYAARSYGQYRRLSAFKGPWLAAWSDMWFAKCAFGIGPENHALLTDVCNKYGQFLL